jgi:uncharacterized protein
MIFNGPIGVGTLLTVCLGGLILNYFMPFTEKVLDPILTHSSTLTNYDKGKNHSILKCTLCKGHLKKVLGYL